jgi:hypothetical protein
MPALEFCSDSVCTLIGVPYPALWGVVAGLLRIVPYIGTMVAATLPIALSLAAFNSWLPPLLVFLLFAGLELTVSNFVEPWLYGANTGLSSLALLVAAVFWTILWGPSGLILSTPLTVCVVVLGRYVPQLSFLHVLLGDEVILGTEAQVYQRLLAMDQPEARAIVDQLLERKSLVGVIRFGAHTRFELWPNRIATKGPLTQSGRSFSFSASTK